MCQEEEGWWRQWVAGAIQGLKGEISDEAGGNRI
jgi:hypothetical protein